MRSMLRKMQHGATLVEAMLVLVVASMIIYMGLQYTIQKSEQNRIDRTALQMQQVLHAALAYHVTNGRWPSTPNISSLSTFLTPGMVSPWGGQPYQTAVTATGTTNMFYVHTAITSTTPGKAAAYARIIAGLLPMSYMTASSPVGSAPPAVTACTSATTTCRVVAAINPPGQSTTNARGINWAGLVRHGGCVPVPACPVDENGNTMIPQVMVVPVSISGVNGPGDNSINGGINTDVYPISNFTAYARGPAAPGVEPPHCVGTWANNAACRTHADPGMGLGYWRACVQIVTEKGNVVATRTGSGLNAVAWGKHVALLAMTRCTTSTEPDGGGFTVFTN